LCFTSESGRALIAGTFHRKKTGRLYLGVCPVFTHRCAIGSCRRRCRWYRNCATPRNVPRRLDTSASFLAGPISDFHCPCRIPGHWQPSDSCGIQYQQYLELVAICASSQSRSNVQRGRRLAAFGTAATLCSALCGILLVTYLVEWCFHVATTGTFAHAAPDAVPTGQSVLDDA
jgi:hypothetical protein